MFWVDQDKAVIEYIRPDDMRGHGVIALPGGEKSSRKQLYDIATFQVCKTCIFYILVVVWFDKFSCIILPR